MDFESTNSTNGSMVLERTYQENRDLLCRIREERHEMPMSKTLLEHAAVSIEAKNEPRRGKVTGTNNRRTPKITFWPWQINQTCCDMILLTLSTVIYRAICIEPGRKDGEMFCLRPLQTVWRSIKLLANACHPAGPFCTFDLPPFVFFTESRLSGARSNPSFKIIEDSPRNRWINRNNDPPLIRHFRA